MVTAAENDFSEELFGTEPRRSYFWVPVGVGVHWEIFVIFGVQPIYFSFLFIAFHRSEACGESACLC